MQIQIQIQNKKTHVNISKPEKCSCSSFLITNYNASPPGSHQWPSRPLTINCIYFVYLFRAIISSSKYCISKYYIESGHAGP